MPTIKNNGNLFNKVEELKRKLCDIQTKIDKDPCNKKLREDEVNLLAEYLEATQDEEKLLCQKAKDGECMCSEVTNEEIKRTLFDIDDNKALGLDGFTLKLFNKACEIVHIDFCRAIKEFCRTGKLLGEVNATLVTMVPKIQTPQKVTDFRSVACCNVVYKCISKIITNRIKPVLNKIVDQNQSAFLTGRAITDNILLTQEHLRGRGLRQGDPIFSYLFTLVMECGKLPVRYLGVPLMDDKISVKDCKSLVDKGSVFQIPITVVKEIESLFKVKEKLVTQDKLIKWNPQKVTKQELRQMQQGGQISSRTWLISKIRIVSGALLGNYALLHLCIMRDKKETARTQALGFMRSFGCPVTILNTIDHLEKFDGKADEGFFVDQVINRSSVDQVINRSSKIEMRGSEYGEQDKKAAILYEYETFKAIEGEQLLDTYLRYLQVITDLKKCGYKKDNYELNYKFLNNLQQEWKQYATLMRQTKNLMDINIDALYNILKQNQGDVNNALGYKKKVVVITSDPFALVNEKMNVSKRKEKVVVSMDSEGSGADDFSELKKITAFLPTRNVKSNDKKEDKKVDKKKRDMSKVLSESDESSSSAEETIAEVAYYTSESESESEFEASKYYDNSTNYGLFVKNDDDQEIFHDAIESASENFIENHIDSQKDYDKSDVDHNDFKEKEHLVDKLIQKFNHKIAKDLDESSSSAEETIIKDQAWMESSSDSDQEINANMVFMAQIEKVLSDLDESSSSAEETIIEVAYYTYESESESEFETLEYYDNSTNYGLFVNNDDDQEIFHDTIESASDNFIEIILILKKTMIINTFKEQNNEFNEQIKVLNEKNADLLAQAKVLQDQLKVKHGVIDTHTECQAQYAKLEEERYEYMIRYSALYENDKQHRKKIDEQEILFDKMSRQLVEMNNNVLRLQDKILEKEMKIS
nr:RNA-directed DNA polymerase, eukaryota, reverse transcriptase zinc-binding domain protein [Tanacetum cinerariifolium]